MTIQHPLPPLDESRKGWDGLPKADLDGKSWTIPFAAKYLEIPEELLRQAVKYLGLEPAGTLNMRAFRGQGRIPRSYPSRELIRISEVLQALKEDF